MLSRVPIWVALSIINPAGSLSPLANGMTMCYSKNHRKSKYIPKKGILGMNKVVHSIESLKKEFLAALQTATTEQELEQVRIAYLSRQGSIANLMSGLKNLSIEEKRTLG